LGIATSLNQFFRSIGGAMGVALLGAVLTANLTANLRHAASIPNAAITPAQAESLSSNPSALVSPEARAQISPRALHVLQQSLGDSIRSVFGASAILCGLALLCAFMLPVEQKADPHAENGEKFVMAEMAVLDAKNEPESEEASFASGLMH
jgi:hypothetical protein